MLTQEPCAESTLRRHRPGCDDLASTLFYKCAGLGRIGPSSAAHKTKFTYKDAAEDVTILCRFIR